MNKKRDAKHAEQADKATVMPSTRSQKIYRDIKKAHPSWSARNARSSYRFVSALAFLSLAKRKPNALGQYG